MYNLWDTLDECRDELDELGIEYGEIYKLTVNDKVTTWWGNTHIDGDGFDIAISSTLVNENNPYSELKNVMMHELLHTCPGCWGHKGLWKDYAQVVNERLGYHVSRCTSTENIVEDNRPIKIKHSFQCAKCGKIINRQRESNFTKNYADYRCASCGGQIQKLF